MFSSPEKNILIRARVQKGNPAKQGLKLFPSLPVVKTYLVQKGNPAKQGLKQFCVGRLLVTFAGPKRKSSKTRIETGKSRRWIHWRSVQKGNPAKQGLKR